MMSKDTEHVQDGERDTPAVNNEDSLDISEDSGVDENLKDIDASLDIVDGNGVGLDPEGVDVNCASKTI